MAEGSRWTRLVAVTTAVAVVFALLWFAAWLLNTVLGPFRPLLAAVVVAALVLLVLRREGD
ncbi:MAG: hypothetical protein ABEJ05_07720 [Haloglomus sp.]